ncbi:MULTISPECIES: arginine deiminase family protein [unclassified Mucilaginibacter]|uniref:arginine deiminase family protein n=1 Tax=unclassified Mucilaginibacter TaxID=2617802 RepID=UPI002AC8AE6A|nr:MULTISPECIES: arginine deiminase family protein [unclassified Mucilaginibacter]MEB0261249.1 arginine deiminase family protein [Mucilaginibacter sp. 10I4]MEB0279073.1 arginine deiminase family protein [Mucilaginibacter sp. 10B2]MEB0299908.1 arginine deiminase family protein [Mucilaginibacter sp. 5C4]WPX22251.1 arginine deiminase family protein [Mucilaginibacter sp. 5C4]
MTLNDQDFKIDVTSEIGNLRSLLVHSPDSGLGKVVPSKAQDWLFEDIVHLDTMRRKEYDYYIKLLMYFLDPAKIKGKLADIDSDTANRDFFKPDNAAFHNSTRVIEIQTLLSDILQQNDIRKKLVAAVCAIESCNYKLQLQLIDTDPVELAKIFISGSLTDDTMIFAPIPNLIFSRDLGIAINNHILLNKPAKKARSRETLLMRYIFFNHPLFASYKDNVIEISENKQHFLRPGEVNEEKTTIEGGDVMMVSPQHLIIGCSERTSISGANEAIKLLFENDVVSKITIVKIPHKRDYMHIDTVFTQVKRNVWVLLRSLTITETEQSQSEPIAWFADKKNKDKPEIVQFRKDKKPKTFNTLEDLLDNISQKDLQSTEPTKFIYSGNDVFPFDAREQWTDSCNLLALKDGVVVGYDRNNKTVEAFKQSGFEVIHVTDLLPKMENGEIDPQKMEDTLILMPSAELSRARGGFHCMSMPLERGAV